MFCEAGCIVAAIETDNRPARGVHKEKCVQTWEGPMSSFNWLGGSQEEMQSYVAWFAIPARDQTHRRMLLADKRRLMVIVTWYSFLGEVDVQSGWGASSVTTERSSHRIERSMKDCLARLWWWNVQTDTHRNEEGHCHLAFRIRERLPTTGVPVKSFKCFIRIHCLAIPKSLHPVSWRYRNWMTEATWINKSWMIEPEVVSCFC